MCGAISKPNTHISLHGADVEGGFGGPNQEVWGPGAKPGKGSGDGVPQKLEHSLKYTT